MALFYKRPWCPYDEFMKLFYLLIFISAQLYAQSAPTPYVESTRVLKSKGYQLGVYVDSFATSKTVDNEGQAESLPEGRSFGRIQTEIAGYYGATNDFQFGGGVRFRQNNAKSEVNGESFNATSSGVQSTFFNLQFAFKKVDQIQYTLEGTFRYTPYSNNEFDPIEDDYERLVLGDTGNEMSAGLGATFIGKNNNFLTARFGYRRPGSDLSQELYWQAEGAMAWKYVALVAGVDGVSSLKNDPYENDEASRPSLNTQTNLYNSSNREWITPYAGINFALGNSWRVELRGSQVVSGHSTDLGTAFGINLIRRVDKSDTVLVDSKFKTYDIEMTVTKVSAKKEYVVVDKGIADDINKGMRIDFFEFDYIGGNVLIASGIVYKTKSDSSIVKITQRFNMKKELKEGLIGRSMLK